MTTLFPGAIDAYSDQVDDVDEVVASLINNVQDAIVAIETALGVNGANISSPNRFINPGFQVWFDGTSFPAAASGQWGPTRWRWSQSGVGVVTMEQSTTLPTVAQAGVLGLYSVKIDCTTIDATIGATDYYIFQQPMEGIYFLPLAQADFTISFWVRSPKTGVHSVAVRNAGFDRSYVGTYTVAAADTWEYHSVTVPASPSAGTWDYEDGVGLWVSWALAVGVNFQSGTENVAWETGNYLGASQVNCLDNVANNFYLAFPVITAGADAQTFKFQDLDQVKRKCLEYREVLGGQDTLEHFAAGMHRTTTTSEVCLNFYPKREAPTITISTAADFEVLIPGSSVDCTALSFSSPGLSTARGQITVAAGLTAGQGTILRANGTVNTRVIIDAEVA